MKKRMRIFFFVTVAVALFVLCALAIGAVPADGDTEASVAARGETFNVSNYSFAALNADGTVKGYYLNFGSTVSGKAGGAWSAVPQNGKLVFLKSLNYGAKTTVYLYNGNSFTVEGIGYTLAQANMKIYNGTSTSTNTGNTIRWQNLTVTTTNSCAFELCGVGTTYEFDNVTTSIASYGLHINGKGVTVKLLGNQNNMRATAGEMFHYNAPATVIVEGGTYTNTANHHHVKFNASNTLSNAFDCVFTVRGGTFTRTSSGGTNYNWALIGVYKNTTSGQINISGGTFISNGRALVMAYSGTLMELNISGGDFRIQNSSASGIICLPDDPVYKSSPQKTIGGKTTGTSINITGGKFSSASSGVPMFFFGSTSEAFSASRPLNVNIANVELSGIGMVFKTSGYYRVALSNITGSPNMLIDAQGTTNVSTELTNCSLTASSLFENSGTGAVTATLRGGMYQIGGTMLGAYSAADTLTVDGATLILTHTNARLATASATIKLDCAVILSASLCSLSDTIVFEETSPIVKFAGKQYFVYATAAPTADYDLAVDRVGAGLYIGADMTKSGLRFYTTLSKEAIDALLVLKNDGAVLTFGTLIAPADYVAAAGAFTKEALDALRIDGIAYVDILAKHSIRDANADGIPESFSGALVGLKRVNYERCFAAIPYVTVTKDGQSKTYYASFNTTDHVRSITRIAENELSRVSGTASVDYPYPSIYSPGQYSAYTEEDQRVLGSYLTEPLVQRIEVYVSTSRLIFEGAEQYSWSSSDETIAKIEDGVLTALLPGTVTLTAYHEESDTVVTYTLIVTRPATGAATFLVHSDAELSRALAAARDGDDIRVCADITLTSTVVLTKSVRFTSKAAYTITGPSGVAMLFNVNAACSPVFDGSLTYRQQGVTGTGGVMIGLSAASGTVTLTVNDGTFYALSGSVIEHTGNCAVTIKLNGGALYGLNGVRSLQGGASVSMNGATIILTNANSDFVGVGLHLADDASLSFFKGEIRSCVQGDVGFNAADDGLDIGVCMEYSDNLATIGGSARIVTSGVCIHAMDVYYSTMIISGGYFASERGHVVYFDADYGPNATYASRLTITGGAFIGNDIADAALYVTCVNTSSTVGLTRCDIYGGEFTNGKWCAARASHSGILNIYGGYFSVASGNGGVVVAGTGSARAYVNVYGGTYYQADTGGAIFLNGSDNTTLTIKGDFNAIGGAQILKSNASTTILGSPERYYDSNLNYVNDSIYMQAGARIRLSATAPGLTFTGVVPQNVIDAIIANGGTNLSYGTLITFAEPLYRLQLPFTAAALTRAGIAFENIVASDGLVARDISEGGGYAINASLVGIDPANYMREYAAVVYVKYTVNGHEVVQYSTYDPAKNAISPSAAAGAMLENEGTSLSDAQKAIAESFLIKATLNGISIGGYTVLTDDSSVNWSEPIGYIQNGVFDVTGQLLKIVPYTSSAVKNGRSIVLRASSDLATMEYKISMSGDDIYITVGSESAALALTIAFMENEIKANGTDTLAVTLKAKTGLVGRDYKVARAAGSSIRMMTYNTLGCGTFTTAKDMGDYITATMAAYAPDFIGTQEHYHDDKTQAALASIGYAKAGDVVTSLAPDADSLDESTYGGIGENTSTEILYLATRWEVVEDGAFRYHWEHRCVHSNSKTVSYGVFRSLETGELVMIINFHGAIFLSDYKNHEASTGYAASCSPTGSNSVEGQAWRLANAKVIVDFFDSLRAKYPGILTGIMGDFNSTVTEASTKIFENHEALANVLGMLDAENKTPGGSSHGLGKLPSAVGAPIDHIFLTEDVAVAKKHIIVQDPSTVKGSDHAPVVVDLARK